MSQRSKPSSRNAYIAYVGIGILLMARRHLLKTGEITAAAATGPRPGKGLSVTTAALQTHRSKVVGGTALFAMLLLLVTGGAGVTAYGLAHDAAGHRFWLRQVNLIPFVFLYMMLFALAYELTNVPAGDLRRWLTLGWLAVAVGALTFFVSLAFLHADADARQYKVLASHNPEVVAANPGAAAISWDSENLPAFLFRHNDVSFYQNNNSCVAPYTTPDAGKTITLGTPKCTPFGR